MNIWTYKKANFKSFDGLQVYEAYLFGEFKGYRYKKKMYQLVTKNTLKGIERKEKFVGYGYEEFYRKYNGKWLTWDEWKEYQLNYDDSLVTV